MRPSPRRGRAAHPRRLRPHLLRRVPKHDAAVRRAHTHARAIARRNIIQAQRYATQPLSALPGHCRAGAATHRRRKVMQACITAGPGLRAGRCRPRAGASGWSARGAAGVKELMQSTFEISAVLVQTCNLQLNNAPGVSSHGKRRPHECLYIDCTFCTNTVDSSKWPHARGLAAQAVLGEGRARGGAADQLRHRGRVTAPIGPL